MAVTKPGIVNCVKRNILLLYSTNWIVREAYRVQTRTKQNIRFPSKRRVRVGFVLRFSRLFERQRHLDFRVRCLVHICRVGGERRWRFSILKSLLNKTDAHRWRRHGQNVYSAFTMMNRSTGFRDAQSTRDYRFRHRSWLYGHGKLKTTQYDFRESVQTLLVACEYVDFPPRESRAHINV